VRSAVEHRVFVRAWQESDSVAEVCGKTGMKYRAASERARFLRRKGVALRDMRKDRAEIGDLAKLAHDIAYSRRG
jgi:hypothetical protein